MLDAEGEGMMIIHNVDNYLTVDTVYHPTRPESSR